jgi:hypothetical protein
MLCNSLLFSFTKLAIQLLHETKSQLSRDFIIAIASSITGNQQHKELYEMCLLLNIVLTGISIPDLSGVVQSSELVETPL